MTRYVIAPAARLDLDAIWDYIGIERDSPAAAYRLIEVLYQRFELLANHPLIGQARNDLGEGLRCTVAGNYVIVYRPRQDEIEIVRVVHGARDIRSLF
jgi:toxin ParE1/3/4